jgi:hypothetical protein
VRGNICGVEVMSVLLLAYALFLVHLPRDAWRDAWLALLHLHYTFLLLVLAVSPFLGIQLYYILTQLGLGIVSENLCEGRIAS